MILPLFILFTGILLIFFAALYQRIALKAVTYSRYFTEKAVFEGESLEMVEEISNAKLLPLPWLRLESSIATGLVFGSQENLGISTGEIYQNHVSLFYLRSYRHIKRRHIVLGKRRGCYRLNSATMTAGDLFGLSRKVEAFPLQLELLVYPSLLHLDDLPLPVHNWLGELPVKRWVVEDPFLTSGTREYRSGDPLGAVNWKATARTGVMQVHQKDYTADSRLIICLNVESSESMWKAVTDAERMEEGIRYAATVAEYALRHGIQTSLICNGRLEGGEAHEPVRTGTAARLEDILGDLARLLPDRTLPIHRLLELQMESGVRGSDYLIITCHRGRELQEAARQLMDQGNGVEWLDVPAQARWSA